MRIARHSALFALFLAACATLALADEPGRHPAYLHALSDLRHARANLDRLTPSDRLNDEEERAIAEIDRALWEIKQAAIDDGKNLNDHPPIDAHAGHRGRYHRAMELLDKAHNDIAREEDDQSVRGLRNRALQHIDEARRVIERMKVQASND